MAVAVTQPERGFTLSKQSARSIYIIAVVVMALAMFLVALGESQAQAAEAAAAGTESEFEISDVFQSWSWIILAGTFAITVTHSLTQGLPFASIIQFSLIILMLVCFLLIAQSFDRDFYRVGVTGLIFFTLLQIGYGNISPDAGFRKSLVGTVITVVILAFIVWLSITLVPWLIQLGR
jgi:uncharacterized membrane protein